MNNIHKLFTLESLVNGQGPGDRQIHLILDLEKLVLSSDRLGQNWFEALPLVQFSVDS